MSNPILVVGGGPAGLSAAHALASAGQKAILVDKAGRLGGAPILSGYAKLVPSGEWARDAIGGMVERVSGKPDIEVFTDTRVTQFQGEPGAFAVTLSNGQRRTVGAGILCTGFTHFDSVNKPNGASAPIPTWSPPRRSNR